MVNKSYQIWNGCHCLKYWYSSFLGAHVPNFQIKVYSFIVLANHPLLTDQNSKSNFNAGVTRRIYKYISREILKGYRHI